MREHVAECLKGRSALVALSGGVDSTAAACLAKRAVGDRLHCLVIEKGLGRKGELECIQQVLGGELGLDYRLIQAQGRVMEQLRNCVTPSQKRQAVEQFIADRISDEVARLGGHVVVVKGTNYTELLGGEDHGRLAGDIPVIEPLRLLFKDEVRRVGRSMGISEQLIGRHPFPGPGLAIRILGDITPEKVEILQNVDKIYIDSLRAAGLYDQVWQAGAVLLPVKSVGVMGDERTYESCVALRAVTSTDGMTADWVHLPYEFLANVSNDIINKVKGVNRVVYDISSKPPATIEWE